MALLTYWVQLQQPLSVLGDSYRGIQGSLVDAEHLVELLTLEPSVKDHQDSVELEVTRGEIKFEEVDFSRNSIQVLKQLTFCAPPGQTIAIVGESGSGKSTILQLLLRFYEIKRGKIFIDGKNIREVKISSLRKHICIVPQVCVSLISLMSETPPFQ